MNTIPSSQEAGSGGDPATIESWNIAKQYGALLGRIPTNFSTAIRTLMWDHKKGGDTSLSPANRFLLVRLMRGPTMKAMVYYATLTFHGEKITSSPYLSTSDLVKFYGTSELATLVGLIYAYRRIKKKCDPVDWEKLALTLHRELEIGAHMGYAVPAIGPSIGVLAGAMRHLAVACFMAHDAEGAKEYRIYLKQKETDFDDQFELKRWGCTSVQVGATILQRLGFGRDLVNDYMIGLSPSSVPITDAEENEPYRFRLARVWIDALKKTGAPPAMTHKGKFYPLQTALHKLLFEVSRIAEAGSKHSWLDRGAKDIGPETTPQLYQEVLLESQSPEELEQFYRKNLPPEILQGLSEDEIKELTKTGGEDIDAEDSSS